MKQDWLQTHRGSFWGQIDVTDTPSRFSGAQGITPFPGEITDLTTTSCAQTRLWSIQSWQKQLICWNTDARWVKAMVHPKINICWTCAHPQALKMLTDGLEWSGLLVDYCDVFISCLDSHSDGTHSLQSIHCWDTDAETHFYKPDEETNSS